MLATFQRSYRIFLQSLSVLRDDKEILIFPLLSGIVSIIAFASFAFGGYVTGFFQRIVESGDRSLEANALAYAALFVWYFISWFVVLFFNVGVVHCARIRLEGGDPTAADGFRAARENLGRIATWALISATVGVILRMIADRSKLLGKVVTMILGTAWAIATYFIVPVMIFEKRTVKDSLQSSTRLITKTWGESLVTGVGVGVFVMLLAVAGLAFPILGYLISPVAALTGLGVTLLYWLLLAIVSSALTGIYRTSLYLYATTGSVPDRFDTQFVQTAFETRGRVKTSPRWSAS